MTYGTTSSETNAILAAAGIVPIPVHIGGFTEETIMNCDGPPYTIDIVASGALDESFDVHPQSAHAIFEALVAAFRADGNLSDIGVTLYSQGDGETLRSWRKTPCSPYRVLTDSPPDQIATVHAFNNAKMLRGNHPGSYILDHVGNRFG